MNYRKHLFSGLAYKEDGLKTNFNKGSSSVNVKTVRKSGEVSSAMTNSSVPKPPSIRPVEAIQVVTSLPSVDSQTKTTTCLQSQLTIEPTVIEGDDHFVSVEAEMDSDGMESDQECDKLDGSIASSWPLPVSFTI